MAELFQGVKYIYLLFPLLKCFSFHQICLFGLYCKELFYFDKLIVLNCNIMKLIYYTKQNKLVHLFTYTLYLYMYINQARIQKL